MVTENEIVVEVSDHDLKDDMCHSQVGVIEHVRGEGFWLDLFSAENGFCLDRIGSREIVGVLKADRILHRPFLLLRHHRDYRTYLRGLMLAQIGLGQTNLGIARLAN
jgi:hypothetical protein